MSAAVAPLPNIVAQHNVDVVDIGVPLLSMHAPYEIAAKLDIYMCYRAFCVFAE